MSLFDIFKRRMRPPYEIVEMAVANILSESFDTEYIKDNFSSLINRIQEEAYRVYLDEQKENGQISIKEFFTSIIPADASKEESISVVASRFEEFDKFYLSIAQSRKSRAGKAFEDIIKTLFKRLDYPFDEQQVINGKPDFLMPNREHYDRNPMDCIIFTAKRTVRERWRQIVTEGTRGLGFYLATIDKKITSSQLNEMLRNRIYLVVPAEIKIVIPYYSAASNVLSFEEFFEHHLDPALSRWQNSGII